MPASGTNNHPLPGSAGLAEWAAGRSKLCERIAERRDVDAAMTARALEIVREFIVERGLILYGGLAIDLALRLKGSSIYPDDQVPDYDFFSPHNVDDAYDLAERLNAEGFVSVGAIPAIHVQTMRVKTDFIFVADVSYTPPEVFERLPTVSYRGMRVLHPDYQRTDMHLAFCFPYSNPPREDAFHRFPKDLRRFHLFQELFPVCDGRLNSAAALEKVGGSTPLAAEVDLEKVALHGFAALAAVKMAFDELAETATSLGVNAGAVGESRRRADEAAGHLLPVSLKTAGRLRRVFFDPPARAPRLQVAAFDPAAVAAEVAAARKGEARVEWFAPYMDSRPLMARVSGGGAVTVDVYSSKSRLLATTVVRVPCDESGSEPVTIVSPQYLLLGFLYEAQVAASAAERELYVAHYVAALSLLEAGGDLLAALKDSAPTPPEKFDALVESSPFSLAVRPFGPDNFDASYLIRLANTVKVVGDKPLREATGRFARISPEDLPDLGSVPSKYFPRFAPPPPDGAADEPRRLASKRPTFDYEGNLAFQRAGQPVAPPRPPAHTGGGADKTCLLLGLPGLECPSATGGLAGWTCVSVPDPTKSRVGPRSVDLLVCGGAPRASLYAQTVLAAAENRLELGGVAESVSLLKKLARECPEALPAVHGDQFPESAFGGKAPALCWRAPGAEPVVVGSASEFRDAVRKAAAARRPTNGILLEDVSGREKVSACLLVSVAGAPAARRCSLYAPDIPGAHLGAVKRAAESLAKVVLPEVSACRGRRGGFVFFKAEVAVAGAQVADVALDPEPWQRSPHRNVLAEAVKSMEGGASAFVLIREARARA